MKRVVVINWKKRVENPLEIFSNLKLLCTSYPNYNYNTLNNYLSKNKIAYENDTVRIERKAVYTAAIPQRKMVMVAKRVNMRRHNDEAADLAYWLSRPARERLEAVTQLSAQLLKREQRMNRLHVVRRKLR